MTGFNIKNFRGSVNGAGILNQNKFLLTVAPPKGLNTINTKDITIRCDAVNLPGKILMTEDAVYRHGYGVPERIPYTSQFHDVTAQFILDRSASQLGFFNNWLELIHNTNTENGINNGVFELEYKNNYASTVTIYMYNDKSENVVECSLYEAFPQSIIDMNLNWQEAEALKLNVSFYYRNSVTKTTKSKTSLEQRFGLNNLFDQNITQIQNTLSNIF